MVLTVSAYFPSAHDTSFILCWITSLDAYILQTFSATSSTIGLNILQKGSIDHTIYEIVRYHNPPQFDFKLKLNLNFLLQLVVENKAICNKLYCCHKSSFVFANTQFAILTLELRLQSKNKIFNLFYQKFNCNSSIRCNAAFHVN